MQDQMNQTAVNATRSVCTDAQYCVFYSLSLTLGLPINLFSILTITSAAPDKITADIFTLNQLVSEFIFLTNSMLFFLISYNSLLWDLFSWSWAFIMTSRPLFQTMVCVEQYLAVVRPVWFLRFRPLRYRLWCLAAMWLLSSMFSLTRVLLDTHFGFLYLAGIEFLFLLLVMAFCCLSVLRVLVRPAPGARQRPPGQEGTPTNASKRRAFRLILLNLLLNTLLYLPCLLIMMLWGSFTFVGRSADVVNNWFSVCNMLAGFSPALLFLCRSRTSN